MQEIKLNLAKYSSIKIGNILNIKIAQNLNEALKLFESHLLIGKANNILFSNKSHKIFKLGNEFDYIKDSNDFIEIGAKTSSRKAFLYFKNNNFTGVEFLGSLPGCIGGIVKMNAGMKEYEIKNIIDSICVNGEWIESKNINFEYRNSNINGLISAIRCKKIPNFNKNLEILFKTMRSNQPKEPSCGSCFKNLKNISAGELLDSAGFKGKKIGNMEFSQKHANFLINNGGGNFNEAIELINLAKQKIYSKYKIKLACEIIII